MSSAVQLQRGYCSAAVCAPIPGQLFLRVNDFLTDVILIYLHAARPVAGLRVDWIQLTFASSVFNGMHHCVYAVASNVESHVNALLCTRWPVSATNFFSYLVSATFYFWYLQIFILQ